ncbi:MAG: RHS repeat-associated core domain-containing protein [Segetibacter sp.]|nr:RHS repeat-associated core domain-containing protein [Segetibacter sp.]
MLRSSVISDIGQDNLLVCARDNEDFYFYRDLTKSVRYLFRGSEKFNFYQYGDFGNVINTGNLDDGNQCRFGGKRLISELNKYDFIYRTYDPLLGKFIQRDPKGYLNGTNLYSYVGNNPLIKNDPFGMESRTEFNGSNQNSVSVNLQKPVNNFQELQRLMIGHYWIIQYGILLLMTDLV